ncbi:MAG TPA: hypothetical protein VM285_11755, partial [Polyangia bacterium]|nr:hypothetical protein [Polyangia bacterium]
MKKVLGFAFLVLAACSCSRDYSECGDDDDDGSGEEQSCGPCGSVQAGDNFITGDPRLDGVFAAVGDLGQITAGIETSFRADLEALASAFGVEGATEMSLDDLAAEVKAAINAELAADVAGSLKIAFVPPRCRADATAAQTAQAACEAKAGCDVSAECEYGLLPVYCTGICSGACSGTCEGRCYSPISGDGCGGTCLGACDLSSAGGTCDGICRGTCAGSCSVCGCDGDCWGLCD